jgi:hypothetical protein
MIGCARHHALRRYTEYWEQVAASRLQPVMTLESKILACVIYRPAASRWVMAEHLSTSDPLAWRSRYTGYADSLPTAHLPAPWRLTNS